MTLKVTLKQPSLPGHIGILAGGRRAVARCPSVNELHGFGCVREHGHPGLCYPQDRNRGPWEDKYRLGYRPDEKEQQSENLFVKAVGAAFDDIERAAQILDQELGYAVASRGWAVLAKKLRAHVEEMKAAMVGEALK